LCYLDQEVILGNSRMRLTLLLAVIIFSVVPATAQLAPPNKAGVAMGHLHYRVRDVEANKRFWVALGGRPIKIGDTEVMRFPDVFVFLTRGESTGLSEGAVVNHIAFRVPSLTTVEAAGLTIERLAGFPGVAYVRTPEGERIELFENAAQNLGFVQDAGYNDPVVERHNRPLTGPVAFHHIHIYVLTANVAAVKAWYTRMFGGTPGKRSSYDAVDFPGVNFNISNRTETPAAATKGRMLDHIGFEITGLEAFCQRLTSMGVMFDEPFRKNTEGFASARFTDPWGTSIELTEGLRDTSIKTRDTHLEYFLCPDLRHCARPGATRSRSVGQSQPGRVIERSSQDGIHATAKPV
jgi:catechol 2,3-dioxygenase-like lactoylglutathione lyase family enzyme